MARRSLIRKQFDSRQRRGRGQKATALATDPPEAHKTTEWNTQDIIYRLVYAAGIRNHVDKKTKVGFKRAIQERESRYDALAAQIEALNKKLGLT